MAAPGHQWVAVSAGPRELLSRANLRVALVGRGQQPAPSVHSGLGLPTNLVQGAPGLHATAPMAVERYALVHPVDAAMLRRAGAPQPRSAGIDRDRRARYRRARSWAPICIPWLAALPRPALPPAPETCRLVARSPRRSPGGSDFCANRVTFQQRGRSPMGTDPALGRVEQADASSGLVT